MIVPVPTTIQNVMLSPRNITANMVAKRGAVLNRGVALVTPTNDVLKAFKNLPKAKLKNPAKANQRNALYPKESMSSVLNIKAKVKTITKPGKRATQVPVVGLIYCRPSLINMAVNPQQEAARTANRTPNINQSFTIQTQLI